MFGPFWSVWCKISLAEVGMSLPCPCPSGSRFHKSFFKSHGSDTPTSARAILQNTDQEGPKILKGSVGLYLTFIKTTLQQDIST